MIDMVVINLYRFEDTVAKESCTLEDAVENIDIGGPTMLRAAAKNHRFVSVVTNPEDYPVIIKEMNETKGMISKATNFALATRTFQLTARYDGAISNYLGTIEEKDKKKKFPDTFTMQFDKAQDLRYGENPHQDAVFYRERTRPSHPYHRRNSCTARKCLTTILWTATRHGRWHAASTCRPRSS